MTKFLGIVLLLAGFCGLALEKIREETEVLKEMVRIKDFSTYLLKEIEYSHIPIPDVCREYIGRCDGKLKAFLESVCHKYEENPGKSFDVIWEQELKGYAGKREEKEWLIKISNEFGFRNVGMQISAIGQYLADIEKTILQKEKRFQDNKKLILYFGVMSGLLISIVLL